MPEVGRIEVVEVEAPEPGPGEVRIAVARCGICGSDLHSFHGTSMLPPFCPGHELSGVVDRTGPGEKRWKEGDRVAVEPLAYCGRCDRCATGNYHLCDELQIFGVTMAGGMATHVVAPTSALFALPSSIDFDLGALTEPIAVSVHAGRTGGVNSDSSVLVLGAGTIGLTAVAATKRLGAGFVAATARYPHQKEIALALGADQVLAPDDFAQVTERPDVVIETVGGSAPTLRDGIRAVKKGGTVVMAGLFDGNPEIDAMSMLAKEVRMVGAMIYNRSKLGADFEVALDMLAENPLDFRRMITATAPLEDAQHAFHAASDKTTGTIKVLLNPAGL